MIDILYGDFRTGCGNSAKFAKFYLMGLNSFGHPAKYYITIYSTQLHIYVSGHSDNRHWARITKPVLLLIDFNLKLHSTLTLISNLFNFKICTIRQLSDRNFLNKLRIN